MSAQLDVKSDSVAITEETPLLVHRELPRRRVTIFEREDIMKDVSPQLLAAIQRELVEMRADFERREDGLLQIAATERLDMERLRLQNQPREWETGSGTSGGSQR